MTFDIELAVADLDARGFGWIGDQDLAVLRDRYPELTSTWDRYDGLQELANESVPASDYAELQYEYDSLEQIAYEVRDIVDRAIGEAKSPVLKLALEDIKRCLRTLS